MEQAFVMIFALVVAVLGAVTPGLTPNQARPPVAAIGAPAASALGAESQSPAGFSAQDTAIIQWTSSTPGGTRPWGRLWLVSALRGAMRAMLQGGMLLVSVAVLVRLSGVQPVSPRAP